MSKRGIRTGTIILRDNKVLPEKQIEKLDYLFDLALMSPGNILVIALSFYAPRKMGKVGLNSENIEYAWVLAGEAKEDLIKGIPEEIVSKILRGKNPEAIKFH